MSSKDARIDTVFFTRLQWIRNLVNCDISTCRLWFDSFQSRAQSSLPLENAVPKRDSDTPSNGTLLSRSITLLNSAIGFTIMLHIVF